MKWIRLSAAILILLAAIAIIAFDGWLKNETWLKPSRQIVADPQQGFVRTAEPAPLIFIDPDSFYWISYAREMRQTGQWRIRHTQLDNAPYGRGNTWHSGLCWLNLLIARVQIIWTRATLDAQLEPAALWCNPIVQFAAMLLIAAVALRGVGIAGFAALLLSFALSWPLRRDFRFGRVDHPGLVDLMVLGLLLCLLAGWLRWARNESCRPHGWFIAAGVFGGLALWIQAGFSSLVIAAAGLAILLGLPWLARGGFPDAAIRAWGMSGALTGLVFYILEYFPNHMGMRLEVNHPLYALAWFCGGDGLARMLAWIRARQAATLPPSQAPDIAAGGMKRCLPIALDLIGILALPLALTVGPVEWNTLRDPFIVRVHECIREFKSTTSLASAAGWLQFFQFFGIMPAIALAGAAFLLNRTLPMRWRAFLLAGVVPALVTTVLALKYNRLAGLNATVSLSAVAAVFAIIAMVQSRTLSLSIQTAILLLLVSAGLLQAVPEWRQLLEMRAAGRIPPPLGRAIALRSIAWELAAISGRPGIPILSGFETPYYQYYGNLLGTGGLYWDNAAGLHAAADFFADYGELKAEQVVRSRGLKYVLVDTRPNVIADWSYCQYGMMGGDGIGMTLGSRLATRHDPPAWLRQVNPRAVPVASRFGFKIYAVTLK